MPLADLPVALWRRVASTRRVVSRRRVVLHGIAIETAARYLDPQTRRDLQRGRYQQAKAAQLASKIEPNDSFLDVGAGLGFTALLTASMVGASNVVAVEADPQAAMLARANFALNNRSIELLQAALATPDAETQDGTVAFYPNAVFGASACSPRAGGTEAIRVPRVDLAALLAEREVTAVNLEAAGHECDIVAGVEDFRAVRVLLISIHEQASGYERTVALMRHLFAHRFALDFADSRGREVVFVRMP